MERIETVRRLSIFDKLSEDELEYVTGLCEERLYKDGDMILEEGVRGMGLFILSMGSARVLKAVRGQKQQAIGELSAGDHFGEMSLVTDRPTSASIRASGETTCLFIPREKFQDLMDRRPMIGKKVLWSLVQTLSDRLLEADRRYARALVLEDRKAAVKHLVSLLWLQTRMVFSYLWVFVRKTLRIPFSAEKLSRIHRKNAIRFKETAFRLKGANVKTGQIASMQVHLLPKEYIEEFKVMRDRVPATEYSLIAGLIQSEFGVSPLELFADFDKVPIAAASMGQVHVAKLHSGEKVVVKILHPGLERSVAIDLWLTKLLIKAASFFLKKVDLLQIYKEFEEPLQKELDLLHEAQATETMAKELAPFGVKVPKVYWRYSSKRVLTLEFIEGTNVDNIAQLKNWKVDRQKLMQTYLQCFFQQAFLGGFFHADPHPANAFSTPEGKLALLDFGMVKRLPDHVRNGLMKEMLGGFFNNPKLYVDGLIEKGAMGEKDRGKIEKLAIKMFSDPNMRSAIFDHDIKRDGDMKQLFGAMSDVLDEMETFQTPQDNLMLMRALGIVIDVCKEVVPEVPVSQLAMPVVTPIFQDFLKKNPQYLQAGAKA
ncbi:MAG: AarF/UbiB family protein [Bdellovibrionota bacterium]